MSPRKTVAGEKVLESVKKSPPKKRPNNEVIVLTGTLTDIFDGVDHNYTQAADGHAVVIAKNDTQYRSLKKWIKERCGLDPIEPGVMGTSRFNFLHSVKTLVYPASVLNQLTLPHRVLDQYDINLPGNVELLAARLGTTTQEMMKGKYC